MLILLQLKIGLLVLGMACVGGATLLLFPQTTATDNSPQQAIATPVDNWKQLDAKQRDLLTKNHLKAIAWAIHVYVDHHNGLLPPAAVPNPNLAPEKRLSGLVLLLPYLGVRPSYIAEDDPQWLAWHADSERAKLIFDQIDLTKAWDHPANADAAKAIVPEFLSPDEEIFLDARGLAVSHFAFVRGSKGRDNGMFPLHDQPQIAIPDISDGTVNTLAVGQIHSDFGPWIAAGPSTARFINPPSVKSLTPGFGSKHAGAAYFTNGDSSTYFWNMTAAKLEALYAVAGRNDGFLVNNDDFARYASATEWTELQQQKGPTK